MSILQNAIDSIALGIEDFNNPDSRRIISCTRNLSAGILLLFKHKLSELSPSNSDESLIKQRVLPRLNKDNKVEWVGAGRNTVDVQQIKERFEGLRIVVDWDKVDKISSYRNQIEHYFSPLSKKAIEGLISDCFIVIRDFIRIHLSEDPLTLLGATTWNALIAVNEVHEKENSECEAHIRKINWKYDSLRRALLACTCNKCGSDLIDVVSSNSTPRNSTFTCRSCGEQWEFETIVPLVIDEYFSQANRYFIQEGDDPVTIMCPDCSTETYVLEDGICVLCEQSMERTCHACGDSIPVCELDGSGFCGYCMHKLSKSD